MNVYTKEIKFDCGRKKDLIQFKYIHNARTHMIAFLKKMCDEILSNNCLN